VFDSAVYLLACGGRGCVPSGEPDSDAQERSDEGVPGQSQQGKEREPKNGSEPDKPGVSHGSSSRLVALEKRALVFPQAIARFALREREYEGAHRCVLVVRQDRIKAGANRGRVFVWELAFKLGEEPFAEVHGPEL
jgi:hypothetical protein